MVDRLDNPPPFSRGLRLSRRPSRNGTHDASTLPEHKISAALSLGFAPSLPIVASAQVPTGPGLSSGSGAGTGTGLFRHPAEPHGIGLGRWPPASGRESKAGIVPSTGYVPLQPPGFSVPLGPGAMVSFPDDEDLFSFSGFSEESGRTTPRQRRVGSNLEELEFARSITDPAIAA